MPEWAKSLSLGVSCLGSLVIVAIGLGAVVETDDPDWGLLIAGVVVFIATVVPLLVPGRPRRRDRETR